MKHASSIISLVIFLALSSVVLQIPVMAGDSDTVTSKVKNLQTQGNYVYSGTALGGL